MTDLMEAADASAEAHDHEPAGAGEADGGAGEPSVEDRARLSGWNPDYDGPNKRTAEEFLAVNERSSAAANDRMRKLERDLALVTRGQELAIQRARDQERAAVRAEMARAAAAGDADRVSEMADRLESTVAAPASPQAAPEVSDFQQRNSWFGVDPVLTAQATRISNETRAAYPTMTVADELKVVEAEMNRLYPTAGKAARGGAARPAMPDAGMGGVRLAPTKTSAFDRLPSTAKQQFEAFKRQGLYEDKDREQYAADMDAPSFTVERKQKANAR